jgi:hypothetical protein
MWCGRLDTFSLCHSGRISKHVRVKFADSIANEQEQDMGMTSADVAATFQGHHVAASYNFAFAASLKGGKAVWKLFVDGKVEDTAEVLYLVPPKHAILRAQLMHDGKPHVVEAFARGSLNIGLDLYVDGKKIASS